ncbi:TPT-domain-containing protein [Auriculariales sp. MPI-PUGE-AT-0066]|nr:TPT-domain-containing protein [Auriculariales sp. MPI-PUGE-AT-0066]
MTAGASPRVYSARNTSRRAYSAFFNGQVFWLSAYFLFNLSLTLYNKMVLVKFPFPWTLTALHALCGSIGGYVLLEQGYYVPARTSSKDNLTLMAFSVLYTVNIAISNVSLQLVTVPFHQVVRATTPLFTILISVALMNTKLDTQKLLTLLPVMAGVGFATYGDYFFTSWGLFLTLLGTVLASLKTVVTSMLQTPGTGGRGIKLHPLDLLLRMSPLAFIQCVVFGWYTGELERVRRYGALEMTSGKAFALLVNGLIAFTANKKSGPLTMTVAANVKQVLTMGLAVFIFDLKITAFNGIGILLTIAGGGWYAAIEYFEQQRKRTSVATNTKRGWHEIVTVT